MLTTFSSTPLAQARNLPARSAVRSLAKPAIAIAAALSTMAALMALRFGLYAATHPGMPAVQRLFEHLR